MLIHFCLLQKLMVLKAVANMGVSSDNMNVVFAEASRSSNPAELRVAAMQALHKMACEQSRAKLLPLFTDTTEDSEIRINAYLALIKCPTQDLLQQVQTVLENEEVNQVGSFVWTHLTNLQETNDVFKKEIRKILEDKVLRKTFDLDKRKFSRNYEGSFLSEMLNMGGKVESNVIWSTKSYIPRSANLNLTVDLFGQSLNLLEVGGRVEGAEILLEKMFGPDGYFPNTPVGDILSKAKKVYNYCINW